MGGAVFTCVFYTQFFATSQHTSSPKVRKYEQRTGFVWATPRHQNREVKTAVASNPQKSTRTKQAQGMAHAYPVLSHTHLVGFKRKRRRKEESCTRGQGKQTAKFYAFDALDQRLFALTGALPYCRSSQRKNKTPSGLPDWWVYPSPSLIMGRIMGSRASNASPSSIQVPQEYTSTIRRLGGASTNEQSSLIVFKKKKKPPTFHTRFDQVNSFTRVVKSNRGLS